MWRASIDHERYRRVDGSWLFWEKRSQQLMNVPFDEGCAAAVALGNRRRTGPFEIEVQFCRQKRGEGNELRKAGISLCPQGLLPATPPQVQSQPKQRPGCLSTTPAR